MENPAIWSLQVLESPGKQCFNVCTNPEDHHVQNQGQAYRHSKAKAEA